jgi:hypothetical protein
VSSEKKKHQNINNRKNGFIVIDKLESRQQVEKKKEKKRKKLWYHKTYLILILLRFYISIVMIFTLANCHPFLISIKLKLITLYKGKKLLQSSTMTLVFIHICACIYTYAKKSFYCNDLFLNVI